ncbi:hypothetical protein TrLO_g42 [Triparma laevis f. longispina]|uniref:Uncharacterized protein n=1 Tax=Triparma laevis f. longispina TaxID=1714387 RepID=A0A9W7C9H7_9STRA|nr:hypothetical protein TrLO_g42 [Triparma laevis f. longispina]
MRNPFGKKKKQPQPAAPAAAASSESTKRPSKPFTQETTNQHHHYGTEKPPPTVASSQARPQRSSSNTFQPLRHRSSTFMNRLHAYTQRTLGSGGTLYEAVVLPRGENCGGWVVVNLFDYFNDLSALWDVVAKDPSLQNFKAGEGYPSGIEYKWKPSDPKSQPFSVSAPDYVNRTMHWAYETLNDKSLFPDDDDEELCTSIWSTKVFASTVSTLFKRIFRVYAILYSSFFQTFDALDLSAELNSCFKHFIFFSLEFQLLQDSEVAVLDIIVKPIKAQHMKSELEAKRNKENKAKRI